MDRYDLDLLIKEYKKLNENIPLGSYKDFINSIIKERGQWNINKNKYFERHHIIPVCLGGTGDKRKKDKNIIWLYPEEHYIAHKLLFLENQKNKKLAYAWLMMAFVKSDNQKRFDFISSEEYAILKQIRSKLSRKLFKNKKRNKNWGKNISKSLKGKKRGHWFHNEEKSVFSFTCPEGYSKGRLPKDIYKIKETRKNKTGWIKDDKYKEKISKTLKEKKYHFYTNGIKEMLIREGDFIPEGFYKGRITRKPTHQRKVIQLDINENIIKIWPSLSEAAREYNVKVPVICNACKNKLKYVKGFKWKYWEN